MVQRLQIPSGSNWRVQSFQYPQSPEQKRVFCLLVRDGTPTFLVELLKKSDYDLRKIDNYDARHETGLHIARFSQEIKAGKPEAFPNRLKAFFAGIPYELNDKTERHYQVVFYLIFKLLGQFVEAEVSSAAGRADAVVSCRDFVYVFEFKLKGTAEEALAQIDQKGYLLPYTAEGKTPFRIGVEFNAAERNPGKWIIAG